MNTLQKTVAFAALLGSAAAAQAAGPFSLTFTGAGSTADVFAPAFLTIGYGVNAEVVDEFGDGTGVFRWELIPNDPVSVGAPADFNFGTSTNKALNVTDGPVLLVFDNPFVITSFQATLDDTTFGNPGESFIEFYDINDNLVYSTAVNQSVPNFAINATPPPNTAVKTIVLPPTAFYDNIQAVPEPSALLTTGAGMAFLGLLRFRRRAA